MLNMPRTKKTGIHRRRGGRGGHTSGRHSATISPSSFPLEGVAATYENHDFSLQSEAFNTQRHQSSRGSDQRLRHTKVNFVSAGGSEPSNPEEPEVTLAGIKLEDVSKDLGGDGRNIDTMPWQHLEDFAERHTPMTTEDDNAQIVVIDTRGGEPVATGLPPPHIRSPSLTPSNSSDEVVVYNGRDRKVSGLSEPPPPGQGTMIGSYDSRIREIEEEIDERRSLLAMTMANEPPTRRNQQLSPDLAEDLGFFRMPRRQGKRNRRRLPCLKDEQILINDYISNMEGDEEISDVNYNHRELGDIDGDVGQQTDSSTIGVHKLSNARTFTAKSKIYNPGDPITSNDQFGSGTTIFNRYKQIGQSPDEAPSASSSILIDTSSNARVTKLEGAQGSLSETSREESVDSGSGEDFTIDEDNDESDDEIDLVQRKIERMTDENIAKLLAKQGELGMRSSKFLLFDGSPEPEMAVRLMPVRNQHAAKFNSSSRNLGTFPGSSVNADAYDNFDIMDFNRPSLKKKGKNHKAGLLVEVSDSEFEASMFEASENDRVKKKGRKDERQALRAEGLLGRKNTKPALKSKHKEGININVVGDEIQNFLRSDNSTLAFPPMNKNNRKVVHDLANAFNLKSKSAGNGTKRFPVLYKTIRSSILDEGQLATVKARLSRRYLPRTDLKGKNPILSYNRPGGGGFNASVSYRDGDIVGASAPELGTDNKGRAMLEKMGWSNGTALGAINNKGILQPVSHVVKTTKAGLG